MGCHGSRIMLGSLPWEKLQDEGQQLQSVALQNTVQRSTPLLSATITSASTHPWGGKWSESHLWSLCTAFVCVYMCLCMCVCVLNSTVVLIPAYQHAKSQGKQTSGQV